MLRQSGWSMGENDPGKYQPDEDGVRWGDGDENAQGARLGLREGPNGAPKSSQM